MSFLSCATETFSFYKHTTEEVILCKKQFCAVLLERHFQRPVSANVTHTMYQLRMFSAASFLPT